MYSRMYQHTIFDNAGVLKINKSSLGWSNQYFQEKDYGLIPENDSEEEVKRAFAERKDMSFFEPVGFVTTGTGKRFIFEKPTLIYKEYTATAIARWVSDDPKEVASLCQLNVGEKCSVNGSVFIRVK